MLHLSLAVAVHLCGFLMLTIWINRAFASLSPGFWVLGQKTCRKSRKNGKKLKKKKELDFLMVKCE